MLLVGHITPSSLERKRDGVPESMKHLRISDSMKVANRLTTLGEIVRAVPPANQP